MIFEVYGLIQLMKFGIQKYKWLLVKVLNREIINEQMISRIFKIRYYYLIVIRQFEKDLELVKLILITM